MEEFQQTIDNQWQASKRACPRKEEKLRKGRGEDHPCMR